MADIATLLLLLALDLAQQLGIIGAGANEALRVPVTIRPRLQHRGHGLDLSTQAWGAVRAGQGLLLSAHGRAGSQSSGSSLDSREPRAQLEQSRQLLHALAQSAQQHGAKANSEPDMLGAKPDDAGERLPNEQQLHASIEALGATAMRSAQAQRR